MASAFTKVVANFITNLNSNIAIGSTTASLASNLTKEGVAIPDGRYCFTVNQGKSNEQHFICNVVGTAISGIQNVDRLGNLTDGASQAAKINDEIKITNYVNLKYLVDDVDALNAIIAGLIVAGAPDASTTVKGVSRLTASSDKTLGTATITVASPAVVTLNNHGLTVDDSIRFTTTGALPTGLTVGTKYYVISAGLTTNTFRLSATQGGTAINTSGTQSGVHTLIRTTPRAVSDTDTTLLPSTNEKAAMGGTQGVPGSTNKFVTNDNVSAATTDQSQLTQNASVEVGEADTTLRKKDTAQSFIPTKTKIRGVRLWKTTNTGTFTGTVTIELQADSSGSPSGSALATVTLTNAQYNALSTGEFTAIFATEYQSLVAGSTYWIVIKTSTSDNANHPNLGTNSAGGYANGIVKYRNSTDNWVTAATIELYFKTIEGIGSQVVKTDSTTKVVPVEMLPSGLIEMDTTTVSVAAPTTSSSVSGIVYSKYLPSGFFSANSGFRLNINGTVNTQAGNSNASCVFNLKLNGTTVAALTVGSSSNGGPANFPGKTNAYFILLNQNSLSIQKIIKNCITVSDTFNGTGGQYPVRDHTMDAIDSAAIDTSGAILIEIEGVASNGSLGVNTSISKTSVVLEKIGY